ncbi:MAG: Uncharacterised protein [Prochlorococcus marinus str. MIT 9215]|nr:MAG: Uncharacterised protein [Prochlorococcus marinus str. MIT 9215]
MAGIDLFDRASNGAYPFESRAPISGDLDAVGRKQITGLAFSGQGCVI